MYLRARASNEEHYPGSSIREGGLVRKMKSSVNYISQPFTHCLNSSPPSFFLFSPLPYL